MSRNAGWLVVEFSLLSNTIAVVGAPTAAEICTPSLGATPVTQSLTNCVTSTVIYCRLVVVGTPVAKGARKVGRVAFVTPVSVQALVTWEMSTAPGIATVFTKNVIVALFIFAPVSPGGKAVRSN